MRDEGSKGNPGPIGLIQGGEARHKGSSPGECAAEAGELRRSSTTAQSAREGENGMVSKDEIVEKLNALQQAKAKAKVFQLM